MTQSFFQKCFCQFPTTFLKVVLCKSKSKESPLTWSCTQIANYKLQMYQTPRIQKFLVTVGELQCYIFLVAFVGKYIKRELRISIFCVLASPYVSEFVFLKRKWKERDLWWFGAAGKVDIRVNSRCARSTTDLFIHPER